MLDAMREQGRADGLAQGMQHGELVARRRMLGRLLAANLGALPAAAEAAIARMGGPALDEELVCVIDAERIEDVTEALDRRGGACSFAHPMAAETWTLRRIVRWMSEDLSKRGVASARLDSELLAAHALGIDRVKLYMDLDRPLDATELEAIRALVPRRRKREPIAYILGRREFWGLPMKVSPAVLVPRPETELLVELSLPLLPDGEQRRVLDLCTGSGCVAVAIAKERPAVTVVATDLSADALAVARENADAHGVSERVRLVAGDLLAPVAGETFDVITANPPYLAPSELSECEPDVRDFEPRVALVAEDGGFAVIDRIAAGLSAHLAPSGHAFCEIGAGQAAHAVGLFEKHGFVARVHPDLGGIERVIEATRR